MSTTDDITKTEEWATFCSVILQRHTQSIFLLILAASCFTHASLFLLSLSKSSYTWMLYLSSIGQAPGSRLLLAEAYSLHSASNKIYLNSKVGCHGWRTMTSRYVFAMCLSTALFWTVGDWTRKEFSLVISSQWKNTTFIDWRPVLLEFASESRKDIRDLHSPWVTLLSTNISINESALTGDNFSRIQKTSPLLSTRPIFLLMNLYSWNSVLLATALSGSIYTETRLTPVGQGAICTLLSTLLIPCLIQIKRLLGVPLSQILSTTDASKMTGFTWLFVDEGNLSLFVWMPGLIGLTLSYLIGPRKGWVKSDKLGREEWAPTTTMLSPIPLRCHRNTSPVRHSVIISSSLTIPSTSSFIKNKRDHKYEYQRQEYDIQSPQYTEHSIAYFLFCKSLATLLFLIASTLIAAINSVLPGVYDQLILLGSRKPHFQGHHSLATTSFNSSLFSSCKVVWISVAISYGWTLFWNYLGSYKIHFLVEKTMPSWIQVFLRRIGITRSTPRSIHSRIAFYLDCVWTASMSSWSSNSSFARTPSLAFFVAYVFLFLPLPFLITIIQKGFHYYRIDDPVGIISCCITASILGCFSPIFLFTISQLSFPTSSVQSIIYIVMKLSFFQISWYLAIAFVSICLTSLTVFALKKMIYLRVTEKKEFKNIIL